MNFRQQHGPGHRAPYAPTRHDLQPQPDMRPGASSRIWMWAMIMMGPAIPISAITRSPLVPLAIILGAALASACVWIFGGPRSHRDAQADAEAQAENARLREKVNEMEERLFALETMSSYERAAAQRAAQQDSPFDTPQVQRDPLLPVQPSRTRNSKVMEG